MEWQRAERFRRKVALILFLLLLFDAVIWVGGIIVAFWLSALPTSLWKWLVAGAPWRLPLWLLLLALHYCFWKARTDWHCAKCGKGLALDANNCLHCFEPVDRCTHCGYMLKVSQSLRCPECGTPISE